MPVCNAATILMAIVAYFFKSSPGNSKENITRTKETRNNGSTEE